MENLSEASIYVGTYAKYNEGSIFGEWVDLSNFTDIEEFYDYCRELHKDEEDPEFMFQDWQNIPDTLIGESSLSDKIFDIIEAVKSFDDIRKDAFSTWLDNRGSESDNIDTLKSKFNDEYCGQYETEEDFAYEYIENYHSDLPQLALDYFDYEKFARNLFSTDYYMDEGYVFRNT